MGKLFKYLIILALLGGLATGGSYAAAYFAQGEIVGVDEPLGPRQDKLWWQGYDSLPGKPKVWVFSFQGGSVTGVPKATIIVDLKGNVILTKPRDLHERVERWRAARSSAD